MFWVNWVLVMPVSLTNSTQAGDSGWMPNGLKPPAQRLAPPSGAWSSACIRSTLTLPRASWSMIVRPQE